MTDRIVRRPYAEPQLRKREHLVDVVESPATTTTSGAPIIKGGCFAADSKYAEPTLNKREKLGDVTGIGATSGPPI